MPIPVSGELPEGFILGNAATHRASPDGRLTAPGAMRAFTTDCQ